MKTTATLAPPDLMTAEEFYDWAHLPENIDYPYELEDGKVVLMSRPGVQHGLVCWLVIAALTDFVRLRKKGYLLTNDTGLIVKRMPDSLRGPDVMLFLESHYQSVAESDPKHSEQTPDLIVEVFSPNDRVGKLNKRIKQYHAKGVPLVWVVYPQDYAVDVYRPGIPTDSFGEADTLDGGTALPDFKLPVADLFRLPGTPHE